MTRLKKALNTLSLALKDIVDAHYDDEFQDLGIPQMVSIARERHSARKKGYSVLCYACKSLDPVGLLIGTKSDIGRLTLGPIDSLRASSHCSLCQLFVEALSFSDPKENRSSLATEVFCELHTMDNNDISLRVSDSLGRSGAVYLSREHTVKVRSVPAYPGASDRLNHLDHFGYHDEACYAVGSDRIDTSVIRSWVESCMSDHVYPCSPYNPRVLQRNKDGGLSMYDTNSRGNRPTIRLMLVDTHEERLVEHIVSERSETPYIALSYVWGQTPMLQTSMSNLADLKAPGALSTQAVHLPRTVRDAMALVKGIGYKFLWVDALCIVQDGPNKCKEIEEMNLIYMRARLTIVAMAGGDANSGLPGVMPGTRTQPAVVIDGYKLLAKLPSFEVELKRSRHFTRGWTYQEMLLASRCLFVSPYQVHFRCTKGTASEGRGPEIKSSIFHTVSTLIWPIQDVDSTRFINAYEDYVKAYTRRFLTYDNDILNAFTGVLKELSLLFASSFHEAIPGADIVRALLWCPTASPKRRSSTTKPPTDSTPYFPSWSWIGWKGPITYAVSRIGKATDRTDMQGLLLEASLQWKRAGATGFEKIKTTNTAQGEPKGTSCGFDDCHISLKTDDKDRHTAPQEVLTVWPNAESQGRAQDSPAELTNLSILRFRASTVMAGSYYFGECEFRQVESYDSVETMQFLPIYDVHKRQCGGLYNPAVNGLTLNESQQFSIIAMSAFRTTNYSAHGLIDDHYGFMYNGGPDRSKCRCLLHIILIKSHGEIAERVATGLMHPKAWSNAQPRPEYTLINLA